VLDLFQYAYHRIQHAALWPLHGIHHAVRNLSAATNYGHFLEAPFRRALLMLPYSLIVLRHGPQPALLPLLLPVLLAWQETYIHSPTRVSLGPLRYLVVDNAYHRIHHSADPAHLGKNYGIITPLWDVLFGTAYFPKPGEWPQTGVEGLPEPTTVGAFLLFPWREWRRGGAFRTLAARVSRGERWLSSVRGRTRYSPAPHLGGTGSAMLTDGDEPPTQSRTWPA
jgi:sterol desaturase/sphingolipid hydroxylase (fatty acid hydroxylase superfamily)